MQDLRIAAVSCRAPFGEIEGNLARSEQWVERAAAAGAALVCFPEMHISGYCNHSDIAELAQPLTGPAGSRLAHLAREFGVIILAGFAEYNPHGRPYAAHCVFQPAGRVEVYRKLHLAPNEMPYFSAGQDVPVFKVPQAAFGIQMCYDGHFPELSTAMTRNGAHILFMPHASPRGDAAAKHQSWMRHLPARAYDNGVFVVACNQWGDNGKGLTFPGNAMVVAPSGNILSKWVADEEGMLVADLRAAELQAVRSHPMRYFFPNRRPELY